MGVTISLYSLITTVVIYNIALALIFSLRVKSSFLKRYGADTMLFITLLSVIRLLIPLDFINAHVIRSEKLVPAVKTAVELRPFPSVGLTAGHFVLLVWLTGACFVAWKYAASLYTAVRVRKFYARLRNAKAEQAAIKLGVKCPVLISDGVPTPYTAGIIRPVIYLPDLSLSPEEWRHVLLHETRHIKSCDMWIKLLYAVIEALTWWNPVSRMFMRELDAMLDIRCDRMVTAGMAERERVEYCGTMHKVMKLTKIGRGEVANVYFTRCEEYVKERFEMILYPNKRANRRKKSAVFVAALVIFFLSYFVIIQPYYYAPLDADAKMSIDYEDDTVERFILFDGENYYLYADNILRGNLSGEQVEEEPYSSLPIYGGVSK